MEAHATANIDILEEVTTSEKTENTSYPKNFSGVVSTAKHYIQAGNSTKDIAGCVFDELEGSDKKVILEALEKGCGLSKVHACIYYHNILKIQRHANKFVFEAEVQA